jgi:uncharacterized protein (DUF2236 family)
MAPPAGDDLWEYGRWLRELLASAEDPGYWGPSSAMWRLHREAALGLGLGRAILLQLAHPWVAQAVADHSTFRQQPVERFLSTIAAAYLLVFGSRRQADAAAARIRAVHARITGTLSEDVGRWRRGTPYRAADPDALLWVLATLMDTTLVVYEACFAPLPAPVAEAYLRDTARLGALVELPVERVPRDRASLEAYMRASVADGTVAVGETARHLARSVLYPDLPRGARAATWLARAGNRAVTEALMPAELRRQYGSLLAVRHPHLRRLGGMAGRRLLHRLPARLRLDPVAAIALQRAGGLG